MLRMDQVHVIRHKVLVEGLSIRRVAREMGVSRNTVRKYLKVSEPGRREPVVVLDAAEDGESHEPAGRGGGDTVTVEEPTSVEAPTLASISTTRHRRGDVHSVAASAGSRYRK